MKILARMCSSTIIAAVGVALSASLAVAGPMQLTGEFGVGSTGSAQYHIPIAVPPGTSGMAPNLSLDYDSQRGSGIVGWSLNGFSAIRRCPRTQAQDSAAGRVGYDANDRYCLDGQRLVAIVGAYGANLTQYRTEVESRRRVISSGAAGSGPSWFEVRLASGRILEYGNTADSNILAKGKTSVRVWALNKITDTKGNYLTIAYNNEYGLRQDPPSQFIFARMLSVFSAVFDRAQNAAINRLHEAQRTGQIKHFAFPYLGQQDVQLPSPPPNLVRREEVHAYPTDFNSMPSDWIDRLSLRGEQLTLCLVREYVPDMRNN